MAGESLPAGARGMVRRGTVDLGAHLVLRRDRTEGSILPASLGFLAIEGIALGIGRGDCPLGPFQRDLGDPVPFFELVLPPRAAKAAIPVLVIVSGLGIAAIAVQELNRGGAD